MDLPCVRCDPCANKPATLEVVLDKIKAAKNRVGFNLWDIFKEVDDYNTNYLSESKFLSVLLGPLKSIIGLTTGDVQLLLYKFKALDGRIAYTQLCRWIHDGEDPPIRSEEDYERENVYKSHTLSDKDEATVKDALTRIAVTVPPQKMILKPFFQDHELLNRGSGQLSRNTFMRILSFLGVALAEHDLRLLFEKYRYDAFTMKYNAFLKDLNEIYQYLIDRGMMDNAGRYRPDRLDDDPNILPKPELEKAPRGLEYGMMKVWSQNCLGQTAGVEGAIVFRKLFEHVRKERLRVEDYFKHFDPDDVGRVPKDVAVKCVYDWLCVSERCFNNLYVAPWEMEFICKIYEDPRYKERFLWKVFMDDLERGIPEEELETWPRREKVREALNPFDVLYRPPTPPRCEVTTIDSTISHIKRSLIKMPRARKLFKVLDNYVKENESFIVPYRKFEWTFLEHGILLSEEELDQIRHYYGSLKGIDWKDFSEELSKRNPFEKDDETKLQLMNMKKQVELSKQLMTDSMETNIVEVLAKIKTKAICKRIWLKDSLKPFDEMNKQLITRDEFQRGLDNCGIVLTTKEMDTVLDVFALPEDPEMIEYNRFCRCVDEDSLPPCLVRLPLKEAMAMEEARARQVLPTHQYINFEARITLGNAIDKLAKYVTLANTDFFKSLDKDNTGTVSKLEFQRALHKLNCLHLISNKELETIVESFGITRGLDVELDYMAFLNAMDIVHMTRKAAKTV